VDISHDSAVFCDRRVGHPGFCLARCTKSAGCKDRAGHPGHCIPLPLTPLGHTSWVDAADPERCAREVSPAMLRR
jgi:hypothetical protein